MKNTTNSPSTKRESSIRDSAKNSLKSEQLNQAVKAVSAFCTKRSPAHKKFTAAVFATLAAFNGEIVAVQTLSN